MLKAVYARYPDEETFTKQAESHRRDERKHYLMFKQYFEERGYMPYAVDKGVWHIDKLIGLTFGCGIDQLDADAMIADDELFLKLCRIIMITEIRGMNQLDVLLEEKIAGSDPALRKVFEVIRKDEPSHWRPYQYWLETNEGGKPRLNERAADFFVHRSLVFYKVPSLYLNPRLPRRQDWYDDEEDHLGYKKCLAA